MAHWAEINDKNIVQRVLVTANDDPNGDEGYQWLVDNLGGTWIKTSYNGNIRKRFAAIGYTYDADRDAFIEPKPYKSWTLDPETLAWQAPTAYPTDGQNYYWNEKTKTWILIPIEEPN